MAYTSFAVNDAYAVKLWAKALDVEALVDHVADQAEQQQQMMMDAAGPEGEGGGAQKPMAGMGKAKLPNFKLVGGGNK